MFCCRKSVCLVLMAILPVPLPAEDTGAAILHSNGSVLLKPAEQVGEDWGE